MSKIDFDTKKATLDTINEDEIKRPDRPVSVALQEAEDLYVWCQPDKKLLTKALLNWKLVEDLPVRTGACRYAESKWQENKKIKKKEQVKWKQKYKTAKGLRAELLHHFKFAYENNLELVAAIKRIKEGGSQADMIQDLSDLAVLGKSYPEPLKTLGIDFGLLEKAERLADELAVLLAKVHKAKLNKNESCVIRDKTYTHMTEAVTKIRQTGQYVFWKNPERKQGYVSKYNKSKKKSKSNSKNSSPGINNDNQS